jgi:hypothetical protein
MQIFKPPDEPLKLRRNPDRGCLNCELTLKIGYLSFLEIPCESLECDQIMYFVCDSFESFVQVLRPSHLKSPLAGTKS